MKLPHRLTDEALLTVSEDAVRRAREGLFVEALRARRAEDELLEACRSALTAAEQFDPEDARSILRNAIARWQADHG